MVWLLLKTISPIKFTPLDERCRMNSEQFNVLKSIVNIFNTAKPNNMRISIEYEFGGRTTQDNWGFVCYLYQDDRTIESTICDTEHMDFYELIAYIEKFILEKCCNKEAA